MSSLKSQFLENAETPEYEGDYGSAYGSATTATILIPGRQ
jgi:hypothetical protein